MNDKPAFPSTFKQRKSFHEAIGNGPMQKQSRIVTIFQEGMTLREWYAGMALQGILSNEKVFPSPDSDAIKWVSGVVHNAHMFADTMIEASQNDC